jgi:hypothetical protein
VIETINEPLWELGDFAIFTTEIGPSRDITAVTDCLMDGHAHTWDPSQGIFIPDLEPVTDDPPPWDTLFAEGIEDCGFTSTRLFEPENLIGDQAIFLTFSIIPDTADAPDGFSIADVESEHEIIPRTFFPFLVDIDFLKDGELIHFTEDLQYPRLEDLLMNEAAQGMAAVPMITFETESLLPPEQDTSGVFRWELKVTDSRVAGYNVTADIYLGEEAAGGPGYEDNGTSPGTTP